MTESLPVKLSLLAPELTKFFSEGQKSFGSRKSCKAEKMQNYPSDRCDSSDAATGIGVKNCYCRDRRSRSRRSRSYQGWNIEIATAGAETTGAEATGAEVEATEDSNLETTLEVIDNILLKMAEEEAAVAAVTTATEKGKEPVEDISEEENFNFQDLLGQELTSAEKEELMKYAISCGYKPGSMLFGGVNEGKLRCLRNRTEAKVVRTFSKSVGLPKIEADLCRYQRQHIAGSLLYANFKVKNIIIILLLLFLRRFLTKVVLAEYTIK
jgi:hypothetical protein